MPIHPTSLLLSLPLIALLVCGCVNGDAECIPEQRSLLLDLKHGFVDPSNRLVSWKPGSNCCNWTGITCDPISGSVIGLNLSFQFLTGGVNSDALFGLTSLQSLDLSWNWFENSSIPQPGFEKLKQLRRLDLSNSGFAGQIPIGISHLTSLEYLDLSDGYFLFESLGVFSLSRGHLLRLENPDLHTLMRNLSNLLVLKLGGVDLNLDVNWITTFLITSAPQLQVLSLGYTNISGSLNKDFFQLKRLEHLDLSYNNILGVLPDFPKECALQRLFLVGNKISGSIPDSVGKLVNLTDLYLSRNSLTGPISLNEDFFQLKRLERLDLSFNNISGVLPDFPEGCALQSLDLSHNNISGVLPDFPTGCALQYLILSGNKISGSIPDSVGKLVNLEELDLADNSLTGPIPGSLFALPLLQRLYLSSNQLSGELDVSLNASTSLERIALSNNQLCGQIPPSFFYLPSLLYLSLESNSFSGAIKLDVNVTMRNLSFLFLSDNKLSLGDLNDNYFHAFPNLWDVGLAGCGLTKFPTFMKNLDAITYLDLSNNKIDGHIPRWIFNNSKGLDYLNLSYNLFTNIEDSNDISTSDFSYIDLRSNMLQGSIPLPPPRTVFLDISNNNFSGIVPPEFFSNLKGANYVSVANNNITGEIPPSICEAGTQPQDISSTPLEILDLSHNLFIGSIPSRLLENTSLLILNLGGNQLTGTIPQNIKEGCQLKSIILSDNHLEGSLPQSLVNCSRLQILDLANNHIVDSFPFWLGDHVGLQVLSLKANRFNGPLIPSKSQEKNCFSSELRILDLSSNHFHGNLSLICFSGRNVMRGNNSLPPLPFVYRYNPSNLYENTIAVIKGQEFRLEMMLKIFYNVLNFSNNNLEGCIPRVIGELQHLHVLDLSHNSLTGKIPSELGDLTQLESLDLSANNLSGEIPQHLTSFTSLGTLNLSSNNLTGSIPQGGQFSAHPNNSFLDNPGLCGIPLSKQCGDEKQGNPTAMPPATTSDHSSSSLTYVIGLALSTGIGFGVGLSVVLVFQNVSIEFSKVVGRWG